MEYLDSTVIDPDAGPAPVRSRVPDPTLLVEARIKAAKLRDFVEESVNEWDLGSDSASFGIIRDYNGLRALVIEASPRLGSTLPPEIPLPMSASTMGTIDNLITYRELLFFCEQVKDLLEQRPAGVPAASLDAGASLFGSDGLQHDPALLAAARVKAFTLLDFIEKQVDAYYGSVRAPDTVLDDYNRLHALIRAAAPELEAVLPREILIPADPKPRADDEPAPSLWSRLFRFLGRDSRPKTPKYQELLYYCQQIARLLK